MKLCQRCQESVGGQSSSSESMMEITDLFWDLFHGSATTSGSSGDGVGVELATRVEWRRVTGAAQRGGKRGESQTGGGEPSGAVGVSDVVVETLVAQLGG